MPGRPILITANLEGKRVIVTGGVSGIGRAIVELFAELGATVAANYLPNDTSAPVALTELRAQPYGNRILAAPGDVSVPGEAESMVARAIDEMGGLDYLINNAGSASGLTRADQYGVLDNYTEEFWSAIVSTNLLGPFRCARAAEKALRASKGAIVSTASIAALGGPGGSIGYNSTKAGLVAMTLSLARIMGPDVRVNAVAPGLVRTPWTAGFPADRTKEFLRNNIIQRMVEPREIAEMFLFLCAGASMITGQTFLVDGGRA